MKNESSLVMTTYKPLIPLKVQFRTFVGVIKCLADTEADQRAKSPHADFTDAASS